jgi:RecJ-like exonuclease
MIHLNPYIEGFDGQLTAGMLAFEVARLIHPDFDGNDFDGKMLISNEKTTLNEKTTMYKFLPAISAIGDRSHIPEAEEYVKNSGLKKEEITKLVIAMDFLAYQLKFDPGRGIYEELFQNPTFVEMINAEVSQGVETQLQSALPYLRTQEINGVTFSHIDLEKYTLRFTYPTPGKVTGMIHDIVAEGKENKPVITLGYLSDMIILRATKPVLPIAKIIETLQKELPHASVDGGGHECAGAIKFVNAHLDAVLESIKRQVKSLRIEENLCE